jgi:hypothetical protein
MPAQKVCLKAVMANWEEKRVWTGEYACSICGMRFRSDPWTFYLLFRDKQHKYRTSIRPSSGKLTQ